MDHSGASGMFLGEYRHTIDAKGRLIIPARFREGLGEKFVLTKGLDGCLFAYPPQEWAEMENKMRSLPLTRADARAFVRFFFAGACECEIDKQGRILIPGNLREYAGIEKDVVIIGVSVRVEIWSAERWEAYNSQAAGQVEEIAEKIVL
ncbi:MraZ protein [Desulfofundulus australicus DSM 11792]|uniref:Transcriptional regulator MraZ n=2 Tax=Peptococcaceae TaxID=186807 RepID=A0A1M5A404_9FIRM|nr:transcriptional regulator MraZ [Thermoanaerobacter sp.]SHF24964.1 MraZ protein [Desulfofundulus australicus DSM 11792]